LNTGSLVEVAYTAARRDLRLLRGQAIFEVAHNPDRPFVVTAGARRITATGTAFDVRLYGEAVRVVLIEGHVAVTPVTRTGLQRIVPMLGSQELSAGEALTAPQDGPVRVAAIDVERATSWRRGQVVFRDDPLAAAVAEMNRYSDDKLAIDDPRVAALTISGAFGAARSENFRAALTAYYPLEIRKRADRVSVLAWRDEASETSG
jgi:transmembrane sensor